MDRAFPSAETTTGKKRRQLESLIIQANIILYKYIILSTIRYFIAKLKEETQFKLESEISAQTKENAGKQHFIQQLHEQQRLIEAKFYELIKELEQKRNFLREEVNKSNQEIIFINQQIHQISKEVKELDKEDKKIDNEIKDIYLKNYETILANPPQPLQLTEFMRGIIEKLNLPENHLLKSAPPIPEFDIIPLIKELQTEIKQPNFSMKNFDKHCKEKIDIHFDQHVNNYYKSHVSPEELTYLSKESKKIPEYEKELIFNQLHQNISGQEHEKIEKSKAKQGVIRETKLSKTSEIQELEQKRQERYDYQDNIEKNLNSLTNILDSLETQPSVSLSTINELNDNDALLSSLLESLENTPFPKEESSMLAKHSMFSAHAKAIPEPQPSNDDDLDNLFGNTHKPS